MHVTPDAVYWVFSLGEGHAEEQTHAINRATLEYIYAR
jgi:hypothetical protein